MKTQNSYTKHFFTWICYFADFVLHFRLRTIETLTLMLSSSQAIQRELFEVQLYHFCCLVQKREMFFSPSLFYFHAGCVRTTILWLAALISEDFQPCVERTDWEKFENADFNERTDMSDLNPQCFDCFAFSPNLPSTDSSSAACSCNLFAGR